MNNDNNSGAKIYFEQAKVKYQSINNPEGVVNTTAQITLIDKILNKTLQTSAPTFVGNIDKH